MLETAQPLTEPTAGADQVSDRVRATGYFSVTGMTCGACSARVQKILLKQPGVDEAVVNLATHGARVSFDPSVIGAAEMTVAVTRAGYSLQPRQAGGASLASITAQMVEHERTDQRRWQQRVTLALPLTVAVLLLSFLAPHELWSGVLAAGLTVPVLFWSGRPFLSGAVRRLRVLTVNMDTLVALGTVSAFALSLSELVRRTSEHGSDFGGHLHFEMTCLIVSFVALGRWFESRTRARAGHAARSLASLAPPMAHRLQALGEPGQDVAVEQVLAGDLLLVKPGERLPVDGLVVDGFSGIDESMLTGEHQPVEASAGSRVSAGSLNTSGMLVLRATAVGQDTVLAGLVDVVDQAQNAKASLQRLADQIATVFVPAVMVIAGTTALIWWVAFGEPGQGLLAAVAVLVVACPCALGLATPVALMVAGGRGASEGILLKSGAALERGGRIDTVVFDKTGALTAGRFSVVDSWTAPGRAPDATLAAVAAVEASSEHPIAAALVRAAQDRELTLPAVTRFRSTAGNGVEAVHEGATLSVGRPPENSELPARLVAFVSAWYGLGFTVITAHTDAAGIIGAYALADTVRPEAAGVVAALRSGGLEVHLLTGDHEAVATRIARQLGIDHVFSRALPAEKAAEVARLQAAGRRVAMVGDGINDAAALVQADLGIAVGSGSDIAAQAADVVLLAAPLEGVPRTLSLTRAAHRVILQNFGWAFGYNLLALPLAATGLLSPALAGLAMGASSLCVVLNSLTLARPRTDRATATQPAGFAVRSNALAITAAWLAPAVLLGGLCTLDPARWVPGVGNPSVQALTGDVLTGRSWQLALGDRAADGTFTVAITARNPTSAMARSSSVQLSAVPDAGAASGTAVGAALTPQGTARFTGVVRLSAGRWRISLITFSHHGGRTTDTVVAVVP